ncbi:hypothetical protein cypCar_00047676, partial [Cyprinus carpio]
MVNRCHCDLSDSFPKPDQHYHSPIPVNFHLQTHQGSLSDLVRCPVCTWNYQLSAIVDGCLCFKDQQPSSVCSCVHLLHIRLSFMPDQPAHQRIMVFKTLAQCVVLGCSWILGFFTNDSKVLEILFLILNSQQGTFIFLIYCVLNNK